MNRKQLKIAGTWLALLAFVLTPVASAEMVLFVDDLGTGPIDVIMSDGRGVGWVTASGLVTTVADVDGLINGILNFTGSFGAWTVAVATGLSDPVVGPPAQIDLNSVDATSVSGGALSVGLTDTDFGPLFSPTSLQSVIAGVVNFPGGSTLRSEWRAAESNVEFGAGTASSAFGVFGAGPFAASGSAGLLIPATALFSLSNVVTIFHPGAGSTSFNSVVLIPAPGASLLAMMGLGMVGLVRRRFA